MSSEETFVETEGLVGVGTSRFEKRVPPSVTRRGEELPVGPRQGVDVGRRGVDEITTGPVPLCLGRQASPTLPSVPSTATSGTGT